MNALGAMQNIYDLLQKLREEKHINFSIGSESSDAVIVSKEVQIAAEGEEIVIYVWSDNLKAYAKNGTYKPNQIFRIVQSFIAEVNYRKVTSFLNDNGIFIDELP